MRKGICTNEASTEDQTWQEVSGAGRCWQCQPAVGKDCPVCALVDATDSIELAQPAWDYAWKMRGGGTEFSSDERFTTVSLFPQRLH